MMILEKYEYIQFIFFTFKDAKEEALSFLMKIFWNIYNNKLLNKKIF